MIDTGLLASIAITLAIPALFVRPWPPEAIEAGLLDASLGALAVGVLVGRLTSLGLDDATSLTSLSDVLIIRGGVEFWAGAFAGLAWLAFWAHQSPTSALLRIAALAPPALVAWAFYEATCLIRDGCPGPASALGLRPAGSSTRTFPIGIAVGLVAMGAAYALDRFHRRGLSNSHVALLAITVVASIRSVASIWLPHIGDDLTRQHKESLVVLALSFIGLAVLHVCRRTALTRTAST